MSATVAIVSTGIRPVSRWRLRLRRFRAEIERYPRIRIAYRCAVGLIGFVIIIVGLVLVPLPGPGWLIVFLGVAALGSEFPAAHRISEFVKRTVARGVAWWRSHRMSRTS